MKIELTTVTIRELVEGYADNSITEEGIVGYETVEETKEVVHTETETREEEVVVGQIAEFEANEFTNYTISWNYYWNYSYQIHYVDTNGNSLTPSRTPEFSQNYMYLIY